MIRVTATAAPAKISGDTPPPSFAAAGAGVWSVGTATAALGAADVAAGLAVAVGDGLALGGVGSIVGATVGAVVGRGVGTGVGTGVGAAVVAARTMTVPDIAAPCMPQT
jgi:hypothetical protein